MNRAAAITRARALLKQRASRKSMIPVITVDENGDVLLSVGDWGFLIRLARSEGEPVADSTG
jgi:hypothetical protein